MSRPNPTTIECEICGSAPAPVSPQMRPLCTTHLHEYAAKLMTKSQVLQSEARYAMLPDSMFRGDMRVGAK